MFQIQSNENKTVLNSDKMIFFFGQRQNMTLLKYTHIESSDKSSNKSSVYLMRLLSSASLDGDA